MPRNTGKKSGEESYTGLRIQTGVRLEKRLVKVLKGLAEYLDMTMGDLLEGIVLHAFDGKQPFRKEIFERVADLKRIYGLDLDSGSSHRMKETLQVCGKKQDGPS